MSIIPVSRRQKYAAIARRHADVFAMYRDTHSLAAIVRMTAADMGVPETAVYEALWKVSAKVSADKKDTHHARPEPRLAARRGRSGSSSCTERVAGPGAAPAATSGPGGDRDRDDQPGHLGVGPASDPSGAAVGVEPVHDAERALTCIGCRHRSKANDPVCTDIRGPTYARRCRTIIECDRRAEE